MTNSRIEELKTMPYEEYLKTPEWAEKRANALQRADYRCQICNSPHSLHVHHRTYENRGDEQLEDLTVLCDDCHVLYHHKDSISHHILSVQECLEHISTSEIAGVRTGFRKMDELLGGGLQRGNLIVVAGRPGMGKSAFAMNVLLQAAKNNAGGLIFCLEMSGVQLMNRMLSVLTGILAQHIQQGHIQEDEMSLVAAASAQLANLPIAIDDTPSLTARQIMNKSIDYSSEHKLDLIVVDYLQLMGDDEIGQNVHQLISNRIKTLKSLARALDVPVILVSQLSRALERRADKRPMLTDLAESGSIEADADVVLFIYRAIMYDPDYEQPNIAELLVAKHRNGPTGKVPLYFQEERTCFHDVALVDVTLLPS